MASIQSQLEDYLIAGQAHFYRLAYSYLKNRDDSLDAVQTAVCRAIERSNTLRDSAMLRSWFTRILINTCLDQLRQRSRVTPADPETLDVGSCEDPLPSDGLLTSRVNALPLEEQTVVKLRFYEDFTLREISEATGTNLSTVKTRLYTALKRLRIALEGVSFE